jgi:hypothetical protein
MPAKAKGQRRQHGASLPRKRRRAVTHSHGPGRAFVLPLRPFPAQPASAPICDFCALCGTLVGSSNAGAESSGPPFHEWKLVYSLSSRKWLDPTCDGEAGRSVAPNAGASIGGGSDASGRSATERRGRGEETYLRRRSDVDEDGTGSGRSSSGDEDEGTDSEGEKHRWRRVVAPVSPRATATISPHDIVPVSPMLPLNGRRRRGPDHDP